MKGFVISWFYPPINSSEGLVTFKLLNRSELDYDVYTQKNNIHWSYTSNENDLKRDGIKTIFSKKDNPIDWADACASYFNKNSEKYSFIMSRSMPAESHVAALKIKEANPDTKWIASFGDPLYNTPYTNILSQKIETWPINYGLYHPKYYSENIKKQLKKMLFYRRTRFDRKIEEGNRIIERRTLEKANFVIFNNPHQKDFMLKQHDLEDSDRFIVIPHSYEQDFYKEKNTSNRTEKITLSHVGHLDNIRSALNLLKAVARVRRYHPELYAKLELNFYGTLDMHSKLYMVDNDLFDKVHFLKSISYFDSLNIMEKSDYTILIDGNLTNYTDKNIYTAGKIADYLGSRTPIFAITMLEGASADIIRETGQILSSHSEDEIYMNLLAILNGAPFVSERENTDSAKNEFDAKVTAKKFDKLVKAKIL